MASRQASRTGQRWRIEDGAPPDWSPSSSALGRFLGLLTEGVAVFDADGRMRYSSAQAPSALGYPMDDPAYEDLAALIHPEDRARVLQTLTTLQANPHVCEELEFRARHADGTWRTLRVRGQNMLDDPEVGGLVLAWRDLTQQREAEARAYVATRYWTDLTGDALGVFDVHGRLLSWNRGAERMTGWLRDEVIGKVFPVAPPHRRQEALDNLRHVVETRTELVFEAELVAKDGRVIPMLFTTAPLVDDKGVGGILSIGKDLTALKALEERIQQLALMHERERIAMDLHDGVVQSLYAAGLSLSALAIEGRTSPWPVADTLQRAVDRINETIDEVRQYVTELRTSNHAARPDLVRSMRAIIAEARAASAARIVTASDSHLEGVLEPERVPDVVGIAHEALSNAVRHAHANEIRVNLDCRGPNLVLVVSDDGRGFDAADTETPGDGLRNIRARAEALGAQLRIVSRPGVGTRIKAVVPLHGDTSQRALVWP